MKSVWTRGGAGTVAHVRRSPAPSLPAVHLIVLPTPWEVSSVQVYLIDTEPLTLIDSGVDSRESREALAAAVEQLGHALDEIERVVLTHYHRDHIGQVQSLRDRGAALEVWAHAEAVPMIEGYSLARDENLDETTQLFREFGVPEDLLEQIQIARLERMRSLPAYCEPTRVDRVVRGGERVPFKDFELEVIHAPGHTAGHILLHHADSAVLFTGDHIMGGAVPHTENYYLEALPDPKDPLRRRPRFRGLLEYRRSLRELRRRSFSLILPAFGGIVQNPNRAVRDALLYYDVRIQRIERSLRSVAAMGQSVTAYELWKALFPKDDPVTEMWAKLQMVIGALDVLEDQGDCETHRRDDGVLVHTHTAPARPPSPARSPGTAHGG